MPTIQTDLHTHTLLSGHAFCTLMENVNAAAQAGVSAIALTEHAGEPFLRDNLLQSLFALGNRHILPPVIQGVRVFAGAEVDILPGGGLYGENLPFPAPEGARYYADTVLDYILKDARVVIASYHFGTAEQDASLANTEMFVRAASDPRVNILGHLDRNSLRYEIDPILEAAKAHGTAVELNEASLARGGLPEERCVEIMDRCAAMRVPIAVSSDAHYCGQIGVYSRSNALLTRLGFPEELIVNRSLESVNAFLGVSAAQ